MADSEQSPPKPPALSFVTFWEDFWEIVLNFINQLNSHRLTYIHVNLLKCASSLRQLKPIYISLRHFFVNLRKSMSIYVDLHTLHSVYVDLREITVSLHRFTFNLRRFTFNLRRFT